MSLKALQRVLRTMTDVWGVGVCRLDGDVLDAPYMTRTEVRDSVDKDLVPAKWLGRFWNRARDTPEGRHPDAAILLERKDATIEATLVHLGWGKEEGHADGRSAFADDAWSGGVDRLRSWEPVP